MRRQIDLVRVNDTLEGELLSEGGDFLNPTVEMRLQRVE
jgi:hypothetical protein